MDLIELFQDLKAGIRFQAQMQNRSIIQLRFQDGQLENRSLSSKGQVGHNWIGCNYSLNQLMELSWEPVPEDRDKWLLRVEMGS